MRRAAEAGKSAARLALQSAGGAAYAALHLPPLLSLDCQRYKWRQNQSHVEVFVPLPEGLQATAGWATAPVPVPTVVASPLVDSGGAAGSVSGAPASGGGAAGTIDG